MEEASSAEMEADLARLEANLRQLKIQYDKFFAGALPKQPFELRSQFEQLVKRYSSAPIRKYAHRFHYNALVSRYNSLSEFWSRTLRALEEGEKHAPVASEQPQERVLSTCRIHDPREEREALRVLHERFLEAQRKTGAENGPLPFESFLEGVSVQARKLQEKTGCDEVELRVVVENRKVHLKARAGR